jgi:hypothetical protein
MPGPDKRLRRMFAVLDDVVTATRHVMAESDDDGSQLARFNRAVLNRGLNMLEASRILLAVGHWEVASSSARQLFELLVNMEYLSQQPSREEACFRYQKFGLLQYAERVRREIEYDRSTGRPIDEERATLVAALLNGDSFDEFRTKDGKWKNSWCGQSTRSLAQQSPAPLRETQWEHLFITWSEETHAAPVALLDAMRGSDAADWVETRVAEDDREVGQMILMLVTLYIELYTALPNSPVPPPDKALEWTTALMDEVRARGQAPPPPEKDGDAG